MIGVCGAVETVVEGGRIWIGEGFIAGERLGVPAADFGATEALDDVGIGFGLEELVEFVEVIVGEVNADAGGEFLEELEANFLRGGIDFDDLVDPSGAAHRLGEAHMVVGGEEDEGDQALTLFEKAEFGLQGEFGDAVDVVDDDHIGLEKLDDFAPEGEA